MFSQWGEDGIIQYIVNSIDCKGVEVFVEIGVEDYRESNTRFLLMHNHWRGFIVDKTDSPNYFLERTGLKWRYGVDPIRAFVTKESINDVIRTRVTGEIGLLSLDVDGNDYWLFEALEVVRPRIVVVEYNSLFGPEASVVVPYDPLFEVSRAHWSSLYYGASIGALAELGARRGYSLVGSNSAGCNAFFVRNDVIGNLTPVAASSAWIESRFRTSRDPQGRLSYVSSRYNQLGIIEKMPIVDLRSGRTVTVREACAVPTGEGGKNSNS